MSKYKDNDLCEKCAVMDAVTEVNGKLVCYRCAKKVRKAERKPVDKFVNLEEGFEDDDGLPRRVY